MRYTQILATLQRSVKKTAGDGIQRKGHFKNKMNSKLTPTLTTLQPPPTTALPVPTTTLESLRCPPF